jgi:hypothetical protein
MHAGGICQSRGGARGGVGCGMRGGVEVAGGAVAPSFDGATGSRSCLRHIEMTRPIEIFRYLETISLIVSVK